MWVVHYTFKLNINIFIKSHFLVDFRFCWGFLFFCSHGNLRSVDHMILLSWVSARHVASCWILWCNQYYQTTSIIELYFIDQNRFGTPHRMNSPLLASTKDLLRMKVNLPFCLCENIEYQRTNSKFIFLYLKIEERVVFLCWYIMSCVICKIKRQWFEWVLFFSSFHCVTLKISLFSSQKRKISTIEQLGKLLHHFYIRNLLSKYLW